MLDIHCHLLPGIDDGPVDMEESLELSRMLVADGVQVVAATPHVRSDHPGVVPGELAERCHALRRALAQAAIPLEVALGGEIDLLWAAEASGDELRLVSYGQRGTDLLLESPYAPLTLTFEEWIFGLQLQGFRILLAHPERNPTFQNDAGRLAELVQRGVLLQVTADSLLRPSRRSRSARLARNLLGEGIAHVISSDSHGPTVERPSLAEGVEVARDLVGARADWMAVDAPAAVLEGRPLPPAPTPDSPKRTPLRRTRRAHTSE